MNGGNTHLGDHLQNAPRNVTYISKITQNEIISIIGESKIKELSSKIATLLVDFFQDLQTKYVILATMNNSQ